MLLTLNNITKYYGGELILKEVNAVLERGEKVGIVGRNGCGKTTLLNIICNGEATDEGASTVHGGATIGFLAQNSGLESTNTILGEMRLVFADLLEKAKRMQELRDKMQGVDEKSEEYKAVLGEYSRISTAFEGQDGYNIDYKIKRVLYGFAFKDKDMETPINALSGGEKTRLACCKL
ncbi:MAG: ABC-F family ATP-binding cassette domain-containing protein, partial [Clostridia bacterium]|nr:ABC-F family ATP-binding cassette domain-containing protein [Clostridia bacterium]